MSSAPGSATTTVTQTAPLAEPSPAQAGSTSRRTYRHEASPSPARPAYPQVPYPNSLAGTSITNGRGDSVSRERDSQDWERSRSRSQGGSRVALIRNRDEKFRSKSWKEDLLPSHFLPGLVGGKPSEKETPPVTPVASGAIPALPAKRSPLARLPRVVSTLLGHRSPPPAGVKARPLIPFLDLLSVKNETLLTTWLGAFVGILLAIAAGGYGLSIVNYGQGNLPLAIGSMGATAVLLYALPVSPLSTPRNVVGGHMISALCGVLISLLFGLSPAYSGTFNSANGESFSHLTPVAGALAVACATVAMQMTDTVHPPGGATALIASLQPNAISLHFSYLLLVLISSSVMTLWAFIIGNVGRRKYPGFYWTPPAPPAPAAPAVVKPTVETPIQLRPVNERMPSDLSEAATVVELPGEKEESKEENEHSISPDRTNGRGETLGPVGEEGEEDEITTEGERGRTTKLGGRRGRV